MKGLLINETNAWAYYNVATTALKEDLEQTFGKDFFTRSITDRVKSFEDACAIAGENHVDPAFSTGTPDEIAYKKIKVIAKALNEGWVADWKNSSQYKYYPWFKAVAGSGLSYCVYDCAFSNADVGSRLCFKTDELAIYAGKQFQALYNDFLL